MIAARTCFLFFIMLPFFLAAQPEVEYAHKSLVKILEKEGIGMQQLQELHFRQNGGYAAETAGKFFAVNSANVSQYHYMYVGRVNSCRAGGCSVPGNAGTDMSSEYFDYFILFDKRGGIVRVHVFNYRATHGYEICSRGWLRQFSGYNGSEKPEVGKTIDGISGATISVHAITSDVRQRTDQLQGFLVSQ
ncbi:MAG: FMN-binding protein [Bacteroidales bacterium]|nr:FMN-binding protein [Bacteroidales bacterium]MDT8432203.1 FMN-binding protein [Bacteroidales bacterium]